MAYVAPGERWPRTVVDVSVNINDGAKGGTGYRTRKKHDVLDWKRDSEVVKMNTSLADLRDRVKSNYTVEK